MGLAHFPLPLRHLHDYVALRTGFALLGNPLWGAGSRLAGHVRNDWFTGSVRLAVEELHRGRQLLLFPEGTRTAPKPPGEFRAGAAYVSHRAGVPIQTVIVEQGTDLLGKGWPMLKRPDMPMHFRIRLGQRFSRPADAKASSRTLREFFLRERSPPSAGT
ncbi:MAG: lysophospholipid acyltransferase family protein [Pseudomonadota bacterium]